MGDDNIHHTYVPSSIQETTQPQFMEAATKPWKQIYTNHQSLPDLETAFSQFKELYPKYTETSYVESLRVQEYAHLEETGHVCLDYCGFGLFTHLQQIEEWESASFALSAVSANFNSHVLYGAPKTGTLEYDTRKRIMDYLNVQDSEYNMVFTASRGSAFQLLADAYPFARCKRLITMYDYESESVGWLVQRAKEKGSKLSDVSFKWPSLQAASRQLQKLLISKRKRWKRHTKGLFVFPAQSRVSGAKYSYQWMSLAQQNNWHVLLDASSLGPKEMDSLGLSLFKPDFIIASFYRLFGADPSGFACLLIKNTALHFLLNQSDAVASGIVRIIPVRYEWSSSDSPENGDNLGDGSMGVEESESASTEFEFPKSSQLFPTIASFSGPMLGFHQRCSPEDKSIGAQEKEEGDSYCCDSTGEVSHSPDFSYDCAEHLYLEMGTSPTGSVLSQTSMSDDQFNGPVSDSFSIPMHNPVCRGQVNLPQSERLKDLPFMDNGLEKGSVRREHLQEERLGAAEIVSTISTVPFSSNLSMDAKTNNQYASLNVHHIYGVLKENSCYKHDEDKDVMQVGSDHCQIPQIEAEIVEEIRDALSQTSSRCHEIEDDYRLLGRSLSPFRENLDITGSCEFHHMGSLEDIEDVGTEEDDNDACEPKMVCRGLDHADTLGLNKATLRLRCLVGWLINSLLQLRHGNCKESLSLVHVYGPQAACDRGASIAFNLYDSLGKLVHPELVQMLADKNKISLSIGFLRNVQLPSDELMSDASVDGKKVLKGLDSGKVQRRIEVVTAALSFLSTFKDAYRLWVFAASFLDVHFISKQLLGGHKVLSH